MPIYEYQCGQCNHKLEAIQKMSDAPLTDCPACGASSLRKLVSAASFRLKGTGWYTTDFRDKQDKKGNGAAKSESTKTKDGAGAASSGEKDSKAEATTDKSAAASADSKPDTTTDKSTAAKSGAE